MSDVPQSDSRTTDGRFIKGHPGGPGRPRKAVKAAGDALDQRAAEAAGELFEVALQLAKERNVAALKLVLDRVWPANRNRPLEIGTPEIKQPRDLLTAMEGVTNATFAGDATAQEGWAAAKVLKAHFDAIVDIDLMAAVEKLQEAEESEQRPFSHHLSTIFDHLSGRPGREKRWICCTCAIFPGSRAVRKRRKR